MGHLKALHTILFNNLPRTGHEFYRTAFLNNLFLSRPKKDNSPTRTRDKTPQTFAKSQV